MRFHFAEEAAAPRQQELVEQGDLRLRFIFLRLIFQPGRRQQQLAEMVGRRLRQRHAALLQESAHFRFAGAFDVVGAERRHAALAADEHRVEVGRQLVDVAALLQALQQVILLQRPVLLQLALFNQREQRHQQLILRLTVEQRTQHAANNGKLIHDNALYNTENFAGTMSQIGQFRNRRLAAPFEKVQQPARADVENALLREAHFVDDAFAVLKVTQRKGDVRIRAQRQPAAGIAHRGGDRPAVGLATLAGMGERRVIQLQRHLVFGRRRCNGGNVDRVARVAESNFYHI